VPVSQRGAGREQRARRCRAARRRRCPYGVRPDPQGARLSERSPTKAKRLVDRVLVGAVPALVVLAVVVVLLNVAPHPPLRAALVLVGLAALAAGGWCSLNFWRCRHAQCLVMGPGWLGFGVFCFAEAGVGHSLIGGYEQPAFLGILALAVAFEAGWRSVKGTNAVTLARPLPAKEPML
jgi:hypothetical protein